MIPVKWYIVIMLGAGICAFLYGVMRGDVRVILGSRVHQTLRVTPAMEAGLTGKAWTVRSLVKLMEPKSILDGIARVA